MLTSELASKLRHLYTTRLRLWLAHEHCQSHPTPFQTHTRTHTYTGTERTQHGWSRGKRVNFWRDFPGDLHLPTEPDPAQPLFVPPVQNLPRRQTSRSGRGGKTAAETEKEGFYHRRTEALRWTAESEDPHGCQRKSVRRDQGEEVLRAR